MVLDRTPLYNLNWVLRETGLKADVLRAWERRYELPAPQRSRGGHRLYSEYDIETIKWLRQRQAEGFIISRAVELWREMLKSGRDPLAQREMTSTPDLQQPESRVDHLRQLWLEACLRFAGDHAEDVLNQAFALYPVETVCTEILQQGLHEIGAAWHTGRASVQQEHFASATAIRRLETLITASPQPSRRQTLLVGCPPGEWHTFPVLLISLFLRRKGLRVIYLGADIPISQLAETCSSIQPDLVILAAQQLTSAVNLRTALQTLQLSGVSLAYGGLIFNRAPELRAQMPGNFLGETLTDAMLRVEQLLAAPETAPIIQNSSAPALAVAYREARPWIERLVTGGLQAQGFTFSHLVEANQYFGNGLQAALELGSPAYLEADMAWVEHLLTGLQIPSGNKNLYLKTYREAVDQQMGESAYSLLAWFTDHLARHDMDDLA